MLASYLAVCGAQALSDLYVAPADLLTLDPIYVSIDPNCAF